MQLNFDPLYHANAVNMNLLVGFRLFIYQIAFCLCYYGPNSQFGLTLIFWLFSGWEPVEIYVCLSAQCFWPWLRWYKMFKVISKSALHHLVSFSLSHPLFCSLHVPLTLCFSFCNVLALFHLPQLYIFAAVKIKIIFESFIMITFINYVTNILFHIYSFKYPLFLSLSLCLSPLLLNPNEQLKYHPSLVSSGVCSLATFGEAL